MLDGYPRRQNQATGHQSVARLAIARWRCQKPAFAKAPAPPDPPDTKTRQEDPDVTAADPAQMRPRRFTATGPLRGRIRVPGDKSISHRSLMLSSLAVGESRVTGLLEGEDVLSTAAAMRAMGADIERTGPGEWRINGVGVGALLQPAQALDMGNSGTSTRLLMGLVASHPITACFTGDASLSKRPMGRVITPLSEMGCDVHRLSRRPPAADGAGRGAGGADRLPPARRLGASEKRGVARRPQHAGHDDGDRAGADA